jgi:hypothetical protein
LNQLRAWQAREARGVAPPAGDRVRVFSVVDDAAGARPGSTAGGERELELRLGPWSVTVRLDGGQ